MIRALITDFGGVLVRTRTDRSRRELERRIGLPLNTIEDRVFASEWSLRAQHGDVSEEEFWSQVVRDFELDRRGMTGREFRREFFADDFLDEELMALIRGVRPSIKTGLISNAWSGLRSIIRAEFPIDDAFDAVVVSAEEKMMKPAARIYQVALDRLGVRPEESIFLDDVKVNVEAANALGMQGVQFQSTGQAQRQIRALLAGAKKLTADDVDSPG
jgi:epoxide hydrolase-like predicted phosphatase